jgi:hypothetical protein
MLFSADLYTKAALQVDAKIKYYCGAIHAIGFPKCIAHCLHQQ